MLYDKVHSILKSAIDQNIAAGINVLVLQNGEEKLYCEYGYRDLENKIPMKRDTILRMYSQTKPVTSAAAMLLVSEGKIDLAAKVKEYLPFFTHSFVNKNGKRSLASSEITVRDLMNMTSGLPYPNENDPAGVQCGNIYNTVAERLYSDDQVTTEEFARMAASCDLSFEPGEQFMYGISADIMGAVIEKVSDMKFGEFLKKRFFEPLEMPDTGFYVPADKQDRLSKVYDYYEHGLTESKTDHLGLRYKRDVSPAFESGGAGLCSTLDDYSHFASMLINNGIYKGQKIMPEYAVRRMTSGGLNSNQKPYLISQGWDWLTGYSYGNFLRVCEDEKTASLFSDKGEYGWDGWLGTFFSNEPLHGITYLLGVQQFCLGNTQTYTRRIKNTIMSELVFNSK